jgi:hypothetical protein
LIKSFFWVKIITDFVLTKKVRKNTIKTRLRNKNALLSNPRSSPKSKQQRGFYLVCCPNRKEKESIERYLAIINPK